MLEISYGWIIRLYLIHNMVWDSATYMIVRELAHICMLMERIQKKKGNVRTEKENGDFPVSHQK
jgi:GTP cyclohydrolase I